MRVALALMDLRLKERMLELDREKGVTTKIIVAIVLALFLLGFFSLRLAMAGC